MCHTYKESKNGGERKDKNPAEDIVADAAEALCCIILGYGKCDCGNFFQLAYYNEIMNKVLIPVSLWPFLSSCWV